jgi:hypothetical protein
MQYLKKHLSFFIVPALALSFLFACNSDKDNGSPAEALVKEVMKSDSGVFRGFALGENIEHVSRSEPGTPQEADELFLFYKYKGADSSSYTIEYDFNELGLKEINCEISVADAIQADSVMNRLNDHFTRLYGPSDEHAGYIVWTVNSSVYGTVRINLNDESTDVAVPGTSGKVAIWIYPDTE